MDRNTSASRGFPKELISTLVCQKDRGSLVADGETPEYIVDGVLKCATCSERYRIDGGILRMLPETQILGDTLASEMAARDREAEKYDRRIASRHYREVISTMHALGVLQGKTVIEYGCGTGRLTKEIVQKAHAVLAVDFSLISLKIVQHALPPDAPVGLVLADSIRFITKEHTFDRGLAAQFFEHIPTERERHLFLQHAASAIKPGGTFVATIYHHDLRRRLKKLSQEGMHKSGIYYYFFTMREIQKLFAQYFVPQKITPIDIMLPFAARLHLSQKLSGYISRCLECVLLMRLLGHLILYQGAPKK
ncbi:MAG: hypothetical protein COV80_00700 [Parcubacteria group bacterium CG11_big_fil_rev_8_21_14_0_20_48_46]|nr:MAG: hypothetical protein AUK21_02805 [Parcubacteria group bacterium CG2_30_48_51]PIY78414.1 MAG: hypothetical protein COY83_00050 [Parcubacteria group bacterium CG_4_10_14_0_8_um_filter_48_154]PIZ77298.1 MAG: hypothetical protein COY03_03420 [bacterium CG_4_10_14_0_2_um_filter_48_144]PJE53047.1 MAG: hypothetical protein COV80_00700 [Parcubacteria group bacterium CG11_big_fil_rev_8_21_14_0_20_48_46]